MEQIPALIISSGYVHSFAAALFNIRGTCFISLCGTTVQRRVSFLTQSPSRGSEHNAFKGNCDLIIAVAYCTLLRGNLLESLKFKRQIHYSPSRGFSRSRGPQHTACSRSVHMDACSCAVLLKLAQQWILPSSFRSANT